MYSAAHGTVHSLFSLPRPLSLSPSLPLSRTGLPRAPPKVACWCPSPFPPENPHPLFQVSQTSQTQTQANATVDTFTVLTASGKTCVEQLNLIRESHEKSTSKHENLTTIYLHLGLSQHAKAIRLETTAYNCANFGVPYEKGWKPKKKVIISENGDVCFSHFFITFLRVPSTPSRIDKPSIILYLAHPSVNQTSSKG